MIERKIILVEDDQLMSNFYQARFEEEDLICYSATDGEAGLNLIIDKPEVKLVITDYMMPGMNGLEMLKRAHLQRTDFRFIMISALASEGNIIDALRMAASDLFIKPFEMDDLLRSIFRNFEDLEIELVQQEAQLLLIQQEKLAVLGQLSAGIAHEINNPNTFIRGMIETLQFYWKNMKPGVEEYSKAHPNLKIGSKDLDFIIQDTPLLMERIFTGTTRIKDIVSSVQTFGHQNNLFSSLNYLDVIEQAVIMCSHLFGEDIKLEKSIQISDSVTPAVYGSETQLIQVLINLLTNAVDSLTNLESDSGKLKKVIIDLVEDQSNYILQIIDTGPGIEEKALSRLFEPFYTTKPVGKGTGLGLYLGYNIITQHSGVIKAFNHANGGAVFEILLPKEKQALIR